MTLKHVVSLLWGYPRSGSRAPGLILSAEGKSNTRAPSRFATSQKATTRLGVSTSGLGSFEKPQRDTHRWFLCDTLPGHRWQWRGLHYLTYALCLGESVLSRMNE